MSVGANYNLIVSFGSTAGGALPSPSSLGGTTQLLAPADGTLQVTTSTGTFGSVLLGATGNTTGIKLASSAAVLSLTRGDGSGGTQLQIPTGSFLAGVANVSGIYVGISGLYGGGGNGAQGNITFPSVNTGAVGFQKATGALTGAAFTFDGDVQLNSLARLASPADGTLQITTAAGAFGAVLLGAAGATTGVRLVPSSGLLTLQAGDGSAASLTMSGTLAAAAAVKSNLFMGQVAGATANFDGFQFLNLNYTAASGNAPTQGNTSRLVTNTGAGATQVTVTLPTPGVGLWFPAVNVAAGGMVLKAGSGVTIQFPGAASTAGGTQTTTQLGASAILVGVNATTWAALAVSGTWTAA